MYLQQRWHKYKGNVIVTRNYLIFFHLQISQSKNDNLNPAERNMTVTIGLVVHAAADGVALGAAATTSHADVEIIVFLAIMLHKAPAAFGLVTFLLHEGIDR